MKDWGRDRSWNSWGERWIDRRADRKKSNWFRRMLFSSALLAQQPAFKLFLLRLSLSPSCLQSDVRECCMCVYVCARGPVCKKGCKTVKPILLTEDNLTLCLHVPTPITVLSRNHTHTIFDRHLYTLCICVCVRAHWNVFWLFFQCQSLLMVEKTLLFTSHANIVVLVSFAQDICKPHCEQFTLELLSTNQIFPKIIPYEFWRARSMD